MPCEQEHEEGGKQMAGGTHGVVSRRIEIVVKNAYFVRADLKM
jgi:hypothetical protein